MDPGRHRRCHRRLSSATSKLRDGVEWRGGRWGGGDRANVAIPPVVTFRHLFAQLPHDCEKHVRSVLQENSSSLKDKKLTKAPAVL